MISPPLEPLRRGNLAGIPPAHLATGVCAKQRLDVELSGERVPQLLAAAILNPREQLVRGEAEGNRCEEMERRRLLFEVAFIRMIHVSDAGAHRIKGFERAHERPGQKNLYLDTPCGRSLDRLCETNCAWVKAGQTFGPVGHHLQLPCSLRNCGGREAQDRSGGQ
jgi:hypothetical protein